eukprot:CAMPEP_0116156618 /NCGR_PEP_ID=MMETSP0329-20121206/22926_1 /TAXON_ID=697910 /ORGANISM="Pseudo-nitzschia arenysensis, Strain B593" /LENGTH=1184 /DNA_ID=CAMNT_0003653709 /DNA_START=69 /DNA_END=3623 /DNA_ORIENTATION=+
MSDVPNTPSKSPGITRRQLELAKWDNESFNEFGEFDFSLGEESAPKSPKSPSLKPPSLKSSSLKSSSLKSPKSIFKSSGRYDGDLSDKNLGTTSRKGDSSKHSLSISQLGTRETEEPSKKGWFWQRKKNEKKTRGKMGHRDSIAIAQDRSDSISIAQKSQSTTTKITQANKFTKTVEDCETEFHDAIRDHDWEFLEGLLKEYDPSLYKKEKKKGKNQPKKKMKIQKYIPDLPKIRKEKEGPEIPISPLLALDSKGRTPLHLCCIEPTPSKLLLRAMNCERNAAAVKDKEGNLPLHLAIQSKRKVNVIERLVRGYYQGSWTADGDGRTPLMLAIEIVIKKQEEEEIYPTKTYWGFPVSPEDIKWQDDQERIWEMPRFLIQNRLDRRKRLLSVEYTQVLLALNKCAPPKVISNILVAGRKCLLKEEVAEKVIFLLISRQYPISLFKWFTQAVTTNFIKEQQDFTGCGVVSAHFRVGCMKHIDSSTKRERDSFAITMKRIAYARKNGKELILTPQYIEWWEKLKLFINLWATHFWEEDDENSVSDSTLLHNALMNPDSPPLLIQLLAKLYPDSVLLNHPRTAALPLHFACRQWKFREYPPRRGEKIVDLDQICEEFLKDDPKQTRMRNRDRLPLHHAIAAGKTWDFIKPLVTHDSASLLARDPTTCLRPFQLAALKVHQTFDIDAVARREFQPMVWNTMANSERDRQMRKLLNHYNLQQLDVIYELLRHRPTAVKKVLSAKEVMSEALRKENERIARENLVTTTRTKLVRSLFRLGNVEGHFIGWCYECNSDGAWKPHRTNFPMAKEAIIDGLIPRGMDKWWRKLKFWLWQDCPWDNIPRRADYLLHCALCNPKVSPWIVELIMECFPRSATIPLPNSDGCYPLHIACVTDTYLPLAFEFPNKRNSIEMVAKAFREAILLKWNDTLPLHYAILKRKDWSEMRLMAEDEPVSLAIPDSENDFFPFQLMALHKLYTKMEIQRFVNIAMITIGKNHWEKTHPVKRTEQMKEVLLKHETESLGCIFELLKRNPMLVHVGTGGDGIEPTEAPIGRISIEEYLEMLESNLPSGDNGETPDAIEDEPSIQLEEESGDNSKTPPGEEEESLSEDNRPHLGKESAVVSDQSSEDDTEEPLDSENEIEIVMNLSSDESTEESDLDPLDNEIGVRRSQVAPDLAEQSALLDVMLDDYM